MDTPEVWLRIMLDNMLYLADFSPLSEAALSFAIRVAGKYDRKLYALHVSMPSDDIYKTQKHGSLTIEGANESAKAKMDLLNSKLSGIRHQIIVENVGKVWLSVEQAIRQFRINAVISGTRGHTDDQRFLLGSVARAMLRRSPVPMFTIGHGVLKSVYDGAWFQRLLVAIDFTPESMAAASYAISLAEETQAQLVLLHVKRHPERKGTERRLEQSVAEAFHQLEKSVPEYARLRFSPEIAVEYGEPVERILETAEKHEADLIVLGIRDPQDRLGTAKEPERSTARKVVAYARCPVLTLRGRQGRIAVGTSWA